MGQARLGEDGPFVANTLVGRVVENQFERVGHVCIVSFSGHLPSTTPLE